MHNLWYHIVRRHFTMQTVAYVNFPSKYDHFKPVVQHFNISHLPTLDRTQRFANPSNSKDRAKLQRRLCYWTKWWTSLAFFVLQTHFQFRCQQDKQTKKQQHMYGSMFAAVLYHHPGGGVKGHGQWAQISQVSAVRSVALESAGLTFTNRWPGPHKLLNVEYFINYVTIIYFFILNSIFCVPISNFYRLQLIIL